MKYQPSRPYINRIDPHCRSHLLSRTAIENCGVSTIPIDEINRAIGLASKCEIPDERSIRKLTQRMGLEAITLWLRVQKLANTYFRFKSIGRNPRFKRDGIAAIPLAWHVLSELAKQPVIGAQQVAAGPRVGCGQGNNYENRLRYPDHCVAPAHISGYYKLINVELVIGIAMISQAERIRWASQEAAIKAEINQARNTFDLVRMANAIVRLDALHAEIEEAVRSGSPSPSAPN